MRQNLQLDEKLGTVCKHFKIPKTRLNFEPQQEKF